MWNGNRVRRRDPHGYLAGELDSFLSPEPAIKLLPGRGREVSPLVCVLGVLFAARYLFLR